MHDKAIHKHACFSYFSLALPCLACISFLFANIDIDECSNSTLNSCDPNANCTNIDGGYMCMCLDGYMGDGEICQGMISPNNNTKTKKLNE